MTELFEEHPILETTNNVFYLVNDIKSEHSYCELNCQKTDTNVQEENERGDDKFIIIKFEFDSQSGEQGNHSYS